MYEAVKSLGSAMEMYAAYLKDKLTEVKKNQGLGNFVSPDLHTTYRIDHINECF